MKISFSKVLPPGQVQAGFPSNQAPAAPVAPAAPAVQPASPAQVAPPPAPVLATPAVVPPAVPAPAKPRKRKAEAAPVTQATVPVAPAAPAAPAAPVDPDYAAYLAWKKQQATPAPEPVQQQVTQAAQVAPGGGLVAPGGGLVEPETPEEVDQAAVEAGATASQVTVLPPSALPHERAEAAAAAQAPNLPARQSGGSLISATGGSDSQIKTDDLVIPRIHIAQQIGELGRAFRPGDVVFNRQIVLHHPRMVINQVPEPEVAANAPVEFVVLFFKDKLYAEKVQGGNGRVCRSEAEVLALGGVLTYAEAQTLNKPLFQTLANAVILIRRPEHANPGVFPFRDPNGVDWTIAQWSMKGSAYTNGAKPIYTARRIGGLRRSWVAHTWKMTTRLQNYPNNHSAFVPQLHPADFTTEAWVAWLGDVLSGKEIDDASLEADGSGE